MSDEHPGQVDMTDDEDLSPEAVHERLRERELQRIVEDERGGS
jgi:hypothetical protein